MEGGRRVDVGWSNKNALSTPTGVEVDFRSRLCLDCYNIEVHMKWLISEYNIL
jgi:hypothetical protein